MRGKRAKILRRAVRALSTETGGASVKTRDASTGVQSWQGRRRDYRDIKYFWKNRKKLLTFFSKSGRIPELRDGVRIAVMLMLWERRRQDAVQSGGSTV